MCGCGPPPGTVWYVDAVYKTGGLFPERFSVSTAPAIPGGFVPEIWGMP